MNMKNTSARNRNFLHRGMNMFLNFIFWQERHALAQDATFVDNPGQINLLETRRLEALIPGCKTA